MPIEVLGLGKFCEGKILGILSPISKFSISTKLL